MQRIGQIPTGSLMVVCDLPMPDPYQIMVRSNCSLGSTCATIATAERVCAQIQGGVFGGPADAAQPLVSHCDLIIHTPLCGPYSAPAPRPRPVIASLASVSCIELSELYCDL